MLGWQALKTNPSKTGVQRALHCRCGREKILALGLCATCYTLKRQHDEYFGGLREQVLELLWPEVDFTRTPDAKAP